MSVERWEGDFSEIFPNPPGRSCRPAIWSYRKDTRTSVETTWHLIASPEVAENPMHTNRQNKSIPGFLRVQTGRGHAARDSVGRQLVSRFPCSVVGAAPRLVYDEGASWQEPRGLSGSQIWISSLRPNRWKEKNLWRLLRELMWDRGHAATDGRWRLAARGDCFGRGSICGGLYFLAAAMW